MRKLLVAMTTVAALMFVGCAPGERGSIGGDDDGGGEGPGTSSATSVVIRNQSDVTVYYLYFSPSSASSWGPDLLGSRVLSPGNTFRLTGVPCGRSYDMRLDGSGHRTLLTRYSVFVGCGSDFSVNLN